MPELDAATPWLASAAAQQALFAALSEGLVVQAADGRVVDCNPAAERILGLSRDQLMGRTSVDPRWQAVREDGSPFPGEQHPSMLALRSGLPVLGVLMGVEAPGEGRRWLRINATPLRAADGSLAGAVASFVDITAQRDTEERLRDFSNELSDLYESAPCGYHSLDGDGIVQRMNATELRWLGLDRDEVVGRRRFTDFCTEEGVALFAENFPRLKRDGAVKDLELDLLHRDGSRRRVRLTATAKVDGEGRFLRSRSMLYDVTALRAAEAQANRLLHEQQAMLDNDLVGMTRLRGPERKTVWVNRAMERIFGFEPGTMIGLSSRVLYPSEEAYAALGKAGYAVLAGGGTYRTQTQMLRADGTPVWVDVSGVKLTDDDSFWMLADITALHDHQQQMEYLAQHDVLTGLPNRLLLSDRLQQALQLAEREGNRVGVAYLDLDGFKPVNDQYGHAQGDALLKQVADRLLGCVRAHDTVCRLGGDEFVLVLTQLDGDEDYKTVTDRVLAELCHPFVLDGGRSVQVGTSIGVALYPDDANDKGLLLRAADKAMYAVKASGRGRCLRGRST